jgi:hypothetical protein
MRCTAIFADSPFAIRVSTFVAGKGADIAIQLNPILADPTSVVQACLPGTC